MSDNTFTPNVADHNLEQVVARENYIRLRDKLVTLRSTPETDMAVIDGVIKDLERAQLAYKATHGLHGNNPIDD